MGEIFAGILLFMYVTVGMWALNKLYYSRIDMIIYESYWDFIKKKLVIAIFFGWLLIPIAVIVVIVEKRKK